MTLGSNFLEGCEIDVWKGRQKRRRCALPFSRYFYKTSWCGQNDPLAPPPTPRTPPGRRLIIDVLSCSWFLLISRYHQLPRRVKFQLKFLLISWYHQKLYKVNVAKLVYMKSSLQAHGWFRLKCLLWPKQNKEKQNKLMAYITGSYVRQHYLW